MIRTILYISFMGLLMAGTAFLVAFTDIEHKKKSYQAFDLEILNPTDRALITNEEIHQIIEKKFGKIEGAPIVATDLLELENTVAANPYIAACEVYQTIDMKVEMKVTVREPLVRVINEYNEQFYLDPYGFAMPLSPEHPSHVIIANGKIGDRYISLNKSELPLSAYHDSSALRMIFPVAWYISKDEFLRSFIDQIYINDNKEMELVPKIGKQLIIFGDAADAREKLENLATFYRKVMSQKDWDLYKTINLKYKNQVVCSK